MEEKYYTFLELQEKYQWRGAPPTLKGRIKAAAACGVKITPMKEICARPIVFRIDEDLVSHLEWRVHPILSEFETTKTGLIRSSDTKKIYNTTTNYGYIQVRSTKTNATYLAHRIIMETWCPIKNSDQYYVDHINGKRAENNIENLRWALPKDNQQYRQHHWNEIQEDITQLVIRIGYDETKKLIKDYLQNLDKTIDKS